MRNSEASVTAASSRAPGRSCLYKQQVQRVTRISNNWRNFFCHWYKDSRLNDLILYTQLKARLGSGPVNQHIGGYDITKELSYFLSFVEDEEMLSTCLFAKMRITAPFNSSSCKMVQLHKLEFWHSLLNRYRQFKFPLDVSMSQCTPVRIYNRTENQLDFFSLLLLLIKISTFFFSPNFLIPRA